jgi:hypothetical protein
MVLRKIFGPKRVKVTYRHGGECIMRSFMILGYEIKVTCGVWHMYRGDESCIKGFCVETRGKETTQKT